MDDMEGKINAFLSNPEAVQKMMGMVKALGAGEQPAAPAASERGEEAGGGLEGLDGLLGSLRNMDPKLMSGLMRVLGAYSGGHSHRETLLLSLKPYLRAERQGKVERAAQIMRMAHTAHIGIKTFLGGEEDA
jgi:hypothetical protein